MKTLFLALCAAVSLTACATPPKVENMIPKLNTSGLTRSEKTLKVAEVTGGEKTNPLGSPSIENEGFTEALVKTLTGSGMFARVSTTEEGDYGLYADIISQKFDYSTITFFVNYRLVDTHTGQDHWRENILSHYEVPAFAGFKSGLTAQEEVVQDNLAQLVNKLSVVLKEQK